MKFEEFLQELQEKYDLEECDVVDLTKYRKEAYKHGYEDALQEKYDEDFEDDFDDEDDDDFDDDLNESWES
jgi:hypothetical protein